MTWEVGLHRVNRVLLPMLSIIEDVSVWPMADTAIEATAPTRVDCLMATVRLVMKYSRSPRCRWRGSRLRVWEVDMVYIYETSHMLADDALAAS